MKVKTPSPQVLVPFLLLLYLHYTCAVSGSVRCHRQDKEVLLRIKKDLGNPDELSAWNSQITKDCCDWYAIDCDLKTNRIIALTIFQRNFSAQIPPAIGDLSYLQQIVLHKLPNLFGTIPNTITKLTRLRWLDVSWTSISGPIPAFLSQIKSLNYLDLSFNNLNGSIPTSLSELPNLTDLHLDRNKLTGSIPDSFGMFKGNEPYLYLSHNQLTGNVPKSLGDLNFSRNNLQGDISFFFAPDKALPVADFSRNMFEFDLSNVVFPSNLNYLDLNHNNIYGSLPQGLTLLNLHYLNVSYNRLCGQIPVGGQLQSFETTAYFHNHCLCGAPLSLCK